MGEDINTIGLKRLSARATLLLAFTWMLFIDNAVSDNFEWIPHEEVIASIREIENTTYYRGKAFEYRSAFWDFLAKHGPEMNPMSFWFSLSRHFELCRWVNSICMNEAGAEAMHWYDLLSSAPELADIALLLKQEVNQIKWLSSLGTAEDLLQRDNLLFEENASLSEDGVYTVDARLAAKENISKAKLLRFSEKSSPEEIRANQAERYEKLFHGLSIILSQIKYDPAQYKSALRDLIRVIEEMDNLRILNSAQYLAAQIQPLVFHHFPTHSYERVYFNFLYADLLINTDVKIERSVIDSWVDTQLAISEMQWPGDDDQPEIESQKARIFAAMLCGKAGEEACLNDNLKKFANSHRARPSIQLSSYALQSLSEFADLISPDIRLELKNIFEDSSLGLVEKQKVNADDIGELRLAGDLFGNTDLNRSYSNEADIRFLARENLRLSFKERSLHSYEKAQLMNYLAKVSDGENDSIVLAHELLARGKFSNLAYGNIQSGLARSTADQDVVRDLLRLIKQSYSFLSNALSKFGALADETPQELSSWEIDFEWVNAFSTYLRTLNKLESNLTELNEQMLELLKVDTIQSELEADEALLYSVLRGQQLTSTCISKHQIRTWSSAINEKQFRLHSRILDMSLTSSHAASDEEDRTFPVESAHFIHEAIFGGVSECTQNISHLFWIPSDNLDRVPLSALITERSKRAEDLAKERGLGELPWLMKRFSHSILKSAAELAVPLLITDSDRLLAIGDPKIPRGKSELERNSHISRGLSSANLSLGDILSLPNTSTELTKIASVFQGESELMLRSSATERNLRSALVSSPGILTFATHGLVSGELGHLDESALLLTPGPDRSNSMDDGLLTTSEIANLSIRAKFISLSACNTAIYDNELFLSQVGGLTAAFQVAGTRTILGTLWSVETQSAELINSTLYASKAFRDGDFSAALNQSQRALIDGRHGIAFQHPRFWAAYNLYGPRENTINLDSKPQPVLRQNTTGRVAALFKTDYQDALAVAAIQETEDGRVPIFGLLDSKTLEITDSMQGLEGFNLWSAGGIGDKFLGVGVRFGTIDNQVQLWGETWKNKEVWTGYMEYYDRSTDHGTSLEVPFLQTGRTGYAHVSEDGTGAIVYPTLFGKMNIFAAWKPAEAKFALAEIPHDEKQANLLVHASSDAAYIAITLNHPELQDPHQELQSNGTTAWCGYRYSTNIYRVDLEFNASEPSSATLVTNIPNFWAGSLEQSGGRLYVGGAVKNDCFNEINAALIEIDQDRQRPIYASKMSDSGIQIIFAEKGELFLVETYQSDSGISDLSLPAGYGSLNENKAGFPISWERFRRQRSRVLALHAEHDYEVLATISSGGDSLVTTMEKTDDGIYVGGSSAGTPFLMRIPKPKDRPRESVTAP